MDDDKRHARRDGVSVFFRVVLAIRKQELAGAVRWRGYEVRTLSSVTELTDMALLPAPLRPRIPRRPRRRACAEIMVGMKLQINSQKFRLHNVDFGLIFEV